MYALGAVLYLLLAGRPPFEFDSAIAVVSAHLHDPPQRPSVKRGAALPHDVEDVVMRCLEKDPAARYPTARALAAALAACDEGTHWTAAPTASEPSPSPGIALAQTSVDPRR